MLHSITEEMRQKEKALSLPLLSSGLSYGNSEATLHLQSNRGLCSLCVWVGACGVALRWELTFNFGERGLHSQNHTRKHIHGGKERYLALDLDPHAVCWHLSVKVRLWNSINESHKLKKLQRVIKLNCVVLRTEMKICLWMVCSSRLSEFSSFKFV